ncbi:hypothetical protein [Aeromicrobium sp. CTD01-1L150]|uniref:hypothetical protein n=1 Tax=Aeromicrobium sp. CTD01-1L150 TaxID=3341830 RepID=UPI0035C1C401
MAHRTRAQRTAAIVAGIALVAAGIATFVLTDGFTGLRATHLVSAALIVLGLGTIRYGTNPRRRQVF